MDEILLHISQRLEDLQVLINSSLQSSRTSLQSYSEQVTALSLRSRDVFRSCIQQINAAALNSRSNFGSYVDSTWSRINPYIIDAQEKLWLILQWIREFCNQVWDVLRQQTGFVRTAGAEGSVGKYWNSGWHEYCEHVAMIIAVVTRDGIQTGALGFALGCTVGFMVGLGWQRRTLPPAVCMKAVVTSSYSGLDGVSLIDEIGSPQILQPDEVLVEVVAASIDTTDIAICSTGYARTLRRQLGTGKFPLVLGRDCSGVILETGRNVAWLARGDSVWLALPPWRSGSMAQLVVARESQVSAKPNSLGFEAAASLPYSGLLAWRAAVTQAGLGPDTAPGKRILIRDAGSAVGCVLVQLMKCWGAQVTAVVNARAREVARQLGAHEILVASVDLEMELRSRPRFDVVFNTVGPGLAASCRRTCTPEGLVICATPPLLPADSYGLLLSSAHTLWVHAKCLLKPVLDRVFAACDVELAFQHAASTNAVGKTVVHFRALDQGRCNYGA
ncbi:hypothetical protein B566_EDAN005228 [Ephemera danica]|nr:hypothetical protein B566_EDAN005228 [Ephemera danica]